MLVVNRTAAILTLIISGFLGTPFFASPDTTIPEIEVQSANLPTFPAEEEITLVIDGQVIKAELDDREAVLTAFLEKKGSPLARYSGDFIAIADKYHLDYRFLPAIAGLESSWGERLRPGTHNPFGWGPHIAFNSFPEAFEAVASGIRERYVKTGKVTPQLVGPTYAASPTWASRVTGMMLSIDNTPI